MIRVVVTTFKVGRVGDRESRYDANRLAEDDKTMDLSPSVTPYDCMIDS